MLRIVPLVVIATAVVVPLSVGWARTWTDSTGNYQVEADLIAFHDDQVVLKRSDGHFVVVPVARLSQADREFLQSEESAPARKAAEAPQTWTLRSGTKLTGRVVDYARRNVTIQRRRGKIYVNDRRFDNLPEAYQQAVFQIVSHEENTSVADRNAFENWVLTLRGQPRTYSLDGVTIELENGDEYIVPFILFGEEDRKALQAGWERWLAADKNRQKQEQEAVLLQSQAQAYQQDRVTDRQIALMQLQLQAYQAGMFDLWEVRLMPQTPAAGPPLYVVVPARDSRAAVAQALQMNPGYAAGAVNRVSRR